MQQKAYFANVCMTSFAEQNDRILKSPTREAVGLALKDVAP